LDSQVTKQVASDGDDCRSVPASACSPSKEMDVDNKDLKSAPINLMEVVVMMMATKLLHRLIGEQLRRLLLHLFDGEDEEGDEIHQIPLHYNGAM
jgi:hypothetical protein